MRATSTEIEPYRVPRPGRESENKVGEMYGWFVFPRVGYALMVNSGFHDSIEEETDTRRLDHVSVSRSDGVPPEREDTAFVRIRFWDTDERVVVVEADPSAEYPNTANLFGATERIPE